MAKEEVIEEVVAEEEPVLGLSYADALKEMNEKVVAVAEEPISITTDITKVVEEKPEE